MQNTALWDFSLNITVARANVLDKKVPPVEDCLCQMHCLVNKKVFVQVYELIKINR